MATRPTSKRSGPRAKKSTASLSTKLPLAPQHRPIKPNQNALLANSQYYDNQDFDSVWLSEFLSYEKTRNESIAKADLLNFCKLPGSTVHPHADKHLLQQSKNTNNQVAKPKSSMSADERRRLKELSRQLNKKSKSAFSKKGRHQQLTPYVEANTKISRVLQHVKLKTNREDMEASQLNDFYELVARETQAATKIQTQCRRVLATRHARQVELEVRSATQIQSSVRMLLAKILLGQIKERQRRATEVRDHFIRLSIARYRRRKRIELENKSAILNQSVVRMFLAKCVLHRKSLQHSFEINQHKWRALSIRLAWKDLRLNFHARQIQCIVRRKLAKTRVRKLSVLFTKSAITIQCIWRRFAAKTLKSDVVYRADVEKMKKKIRIIASEKEYWRQQVEELAKPNKLQHLNNLEGQKKQLEADLAEKEDQIRVLEAHYKDQLELQDQITPRAIASGWEEQLKINMNDTRERITSAKLQLLFRVKISLKKVTGELERLHAIQSEAKGNLDHWSNWHQVEQDRLWDFQRQHNREVADRELRHAIVDEKLKWKVKHFVFSGKPDKRRSLVRGPVDNEVVERLIDKVKTNGFEYQALQHSEHTFKPFQKFWDSLSAAANEFDNNFDPSSVCQTKRADFKGDAAPTAANYDLEKASLHHQKHLFPAKLPFELVQKMREEREAITTSLKPKE
jgi:hypothetical protein